MHLERKTSSEDRHTEGRQPCDYRGRDWGYAAARQEMLRITRENQKVGERGHGPADTRAEDSSLWNCEGMSFCCFNPPSSWYFVKEAP